MRRLQYEIRPITLHAEGWSSDCQHQLAQATEQDPLQNKIREAVVLILPQTCVTVLFSLCLILSPKLRMVFLIIL